MTGLPPLEQAILAALMTTRSGAWTFVSGLRNSPARRHTSPSYT
jgi:hypothetical protein